MGCCNNRDAENLNKGVPKNQNSNFQYQVYAALKKAKIEEISEYIPKKFDIGYKMSAFMGRTPLHVAAEYAGKNVIAYLINNGADVNALDNSGCPPIFLAMASGNFEAVNAIFEMGTKVDLDVITQHGMAFHDFISPSKKKESIALLKRLSYSKMKLVVEN